MVDNLAHIWHSWLADNCEIRDQDWLSKKLQEQWKGSQKLRICIHGWKVLMLTLLALHLVGFCEIMMNGLEIIWK